VTTHLAYLEVMGTAEVMEKIAAIIQQEKQRAF
jgi:hypothetical protein